MEILAISNNIFSRGKKTSPNRRNSKILTINRCVAPGSKLYGTEWYKDSILAKMLKITKNKVNDDKIYRELEDIEGLRERIQQYLYKLVKQEQGGKINLMFCDITTIFFYGEQCEIGEKNQNTKDNRPDEKQIVLLLLTDEKGLPFYWDIYKGNMADVKTVEKTVEDVKRLLNLEKVLLIFNRGFRSEDNVKKIQGAKL